MSDFPYRNLSILRRNGRLVPSDPHAAPIEEAPRDVAVLFLAWREAMGLGLDAFEMGRTLKDAIQPLRGRWLLAGPWMFRLAKISDRLDDIVRVEPRSSPLVYRSKSRGSTR